MFSKEINDYRHFVLFAKGHYTKVCGRDEDWWKILRKVTINYLGHNFGVDIMSDYHFTLNAMNAVYANNPINRFLNNKHLILFKRCSNIGLLMIRQFNT